MAASRGAGGNTGTAGATGTGGSVSEDGAVAFSRAELLGAFGTCAANQVREFRAKAVALDAAASAYAATPDATTRDAARQAFKDALDSWQVLDPIQFGPTASVVEPGGKGFRGDIYNWPNVDRCPIEQNIVARAYESFATVVARDRGLGALEYLLFYEGVDTAVHRAGGLDDAVRRRGQRAQARLRRRCRGGRAGARDGARRRVGSGPDELRRDDAIGRFRQRRLSDAAGRAPVCRPLDLFPRPDGQGQEARDSARSGSGRYDVHGGVASGELLRVPVRGPVEGEPARQPGRRSPDRRGVRGRQRRSGLRRSARKRRRRRRRGPAARRAGRGRRRAGRDRRA